MRHQQLEITMVRCVLIAAAVATAACMVSVALAQPVGCSEDSHCPIGSYCQSDLHHCRECLQCEELHRQPPRETQDCIRSVAECGACLQGYVDDRLGMGSGCTKSDDAVPLYAWVLGGLLIVALLTFAIGVVVYALRNTETFRVLASTRTSVEAPVGKAVAPTAPQPPPYNYGASYEPVRPSEPHSATLTPVPYAEEACHPLVKRAAGRRGAGDGGARESAGSQNARVYANPAYVRNVPPPSYDSAFSDDSDHESPFVPVDENTMESVWTPGDNANGTTNNNDTNENESAGATSAAGESETASGVLVRARRPDRLEPVSPPPAKQRCIEDTNNNNNRSDGSSSAPPSAAPAPPALVINVLNVNALHQLNDVTL